MAACRWWTIPGAEELLGILERKEEHVSDNVAASAISANAVAEYG
jgi:hypothetical protein